MNKVPNFLEQLMQLMRQQRVQNGPDISGQIQDANQGLGIMFEERDMAKQQAELQNRMMEEQINQMIRSGSTTGQGAIQTLGNSSSYNSADGNEPYLNDPYSEVRKRAIEAASGLIKNNTFKMGK